MKAWEKVSEYRCGYGPTVQEFRCPYCGYKETITTGETPASCYRCENRLEAKE